MTGDQPGQSHTLLLRHVHTLLSKITSYNLALLNPKLTPIDLLGIEILFGLVNAPGERTTKQFILTYVQTPSTIVDGALCELLDEGYITQIHLNSIIPEVFVALTPSGRDRAMEFWHWPQTLHAFATSASHDLLEDLSRSLVNIIRSIVQQGKIPLSQMCVTCNYFQAFQHAEKPNTPHHCSLVNVPLADIDLRTNCPEHLTPPNP